MPVAGGEHKVHRHFGQARLHPPARSSGLCHGPVLPEKGWCVRMNITLKPSRALWLVVAFIATLFIALVISTTQVTASGSAGSSSDGCGKKYNPNLSNTYACLRIIAPKDATAGVPFKTTLSFRARRLFKNITLSIPGSYKHKFKRIRRGQLVIRSVMITVPPAPSDSQATGSSTRTIRVGGLAQSRSGSFSVSQAIHVVEPVPSG